MLPRVGYMISNNKIAELFVNKIQYPYPLSSLSLRAASIALSKLNYITSADLGENAIWTFWRVTLPIVFPGVLASLLLCFTISFDEFIMAFFLAGTDPTLPIYIYSQLRFPQKLPGVLALGACILVISFIVVFFSQWLRQRGTTAGSSAGI